MATLLKVIDPSGKDTQEPYLLRISGWTEAQYFREAPETRFVEFEDGEIIMHSPVNVKHQQITRFLTFLMTAVCNSRKSGEVLNGPAVVQLRRGLDYEPDIFFIRKEDAGSLKDQYFQGSPAFIIEVISPGTRTHDLRDKAENYRLYRVAEYWAIDPENQVLHLHLLQSDGSYLISKHSSGRLKSTVLTGFWIEVSWLWEDSLPDELDCLKQMLGN